MRTVTRRLWPWLRMLIAVGILVALGWRLGTNAFLDGLRVIDGGAVAAALGIGLMTTLFSAWRWCLIARNLGLALPLGTAIADYYRALFLNAVLPAGVLGDVHRAVRHGKDAGDVGRGVRAVVLERVAGQIVLLALGVAVLLTRPALLTAAAGYVVPRPGVAAAVLGGLAAAAVLLAWALRRRRAARWRRALGTALTDARLGLFARGAWPGVVALSAATVAGHVAMFVVAARAVGASAPFAQLLPLMVLALVVMALPLNVGGWGPREAISALAFGAAGLGATQGLAAAVVYGVLAFIAALPGLAVLVLRRGAAGARQATAPPATSAPVPAASMAAASAAPATVPGGTAVPVAVPATVPAAVPAAVSAAVSPAAVPTTGRRARVLPAMTALRPMEGRLGQETRF